MTLCRNCSKELNQFMSFGKMPIANAFLDKNEIINEYYFELAPTFCMNCSLFQLKFQPEPKKLFHENYAFFANTSSVMQDHFKDLSSKIIDLFDIKKMILLLRLVTMMEVWLGILMI